MRPQTLFVAFVIVLASIASVQADFTTWDAYTEFSSTSNTASDIWQYMGVTENANTGYWLIPNYTTFPYQSYNGWVSAGGNFPAVGVSGGEMKIQPEIGTGAAIGWKSPITGTVNASFSLHDDDVGAGGTGDQATYDGVGYNLFKVGGVTPLATGYVANGGSSGTINVSGISVTTGDMLYLQVGDGTMNNWYDTTGASFTVSEVPEPSSIVLLACGLIGLLAYAWRKRK